MAPFDSPKLETKVPCTIQRVGRWAPMILALLAACGSDPIFLSVEATLDEEVLIVRRDESGQISLFVLTEDEEPIRFSVPTGTLDAIEVWRFPPQSGLVGCGVRTGGSEHTLASPSTVLRVEGANPDEPPRSIPVEDRLEADLRYDRCSPARALCERLQSQTARVDGLILLNGRSALPLPDGRVLVSGETNNSSDFPLAFVFPDGAVTEIGQTHGGPARSAVTDGDTIFFGTDSQLYALDVSGTSLERLGETPNPWVARHPSGSILVFSEAHGVQRLTKTGTTSAPAGLVPEGSLKLWPFADRRALAVAGDQLHLLESGDWRPITIDAADVGTLLVALRGEDIVAAHPASGALFVLPAGASTFERIEEPAVVDFEVRALASIASGVLYVGFDGHAGLIGPEGEPSCRLPRLGTAHLNDLKAIGPNALVAVGNASGGGPIQVLWISAEP